MTFDLGSGFGVDRYPPLACRTQPEPKPDYGGGGMELPCLFMNKNYRYKIQNGQERIKAGLWNWRIGKTLLAPRMSANTQEWHPPLFYQPKTPELVETH